jgi:alanyl-tRNA synthetase
VFAGDSGAGKSNYCSGNILKDAQTIVDGRGGGRPDMAQGSGTTSDPSVFIKKVEDLLGTL